MLSIFIFPAYFIKYIVATKFGFVTWFQESRTIKKNKIVDAIRLEANDLKGHWWSLSRSNTVGCVFEGK